MGVRVGIVGVSGYGGSELLRLCVGHPAFEVVYASGETTAGQRLARQFPALSGHPTGDLVIQPFVPEEIQGVDVLFASLPTGKSREPLARVPRDVKIVDVGGDHRFVDGWTYGLTELPGTRAAVARSSRVADPGCYPAAALLALAPLVAERAGRAGGTRDRRQDRRERRGPRRRDERVRVRRDQRGRPGLRAGRPPARPGDAGGPDAARRPAGHACLHAAPGPDDARDPRDLLRAAARRRDRGAARGGRPGHVRRRAVRPGRAGRGRPEPPDQVDDRARTSSSSPTRSTGRPASSLAIAALDNLGKGAAGQAVQNANLMTGPARDGGPHRPPALAVVGSAR